jgi:hypothetical protein
LSGGDTLGCLLGLHHVADSFTTLLCKGGVSQLNPMGASIVVFAIIGAGVFAGALLRNTLPKHHLADDAKDVVRLGTGLIGTIAALVLGLLIASANTSYDTQGGEIKRMTANIIGARSAIGAIRPGGARRP